MTNTTAMRRVALPLALLALAGCGTSGDREQARATAERFLQAVAQHDGPAACGQLSEPTAGAFDHCARAVAALGLQPAAISGVEVDATSAKVDLANRTTIFLERGPSGWKVSAAGCAHGPKPADHPYTCELED